MTKKKKAEKNTKESLVKEFRLEGLSKGNQEKILLKITEVALKRMFLETMEKLNDEDLEEYERMINNKAEPDEIENFLRERIDNYDEMLQKVIVDFKEEMKKSFKQ